nr:hypothetical protein [Burkholderia metallica]
MIADPATALDSTIKPTGSLIYPMPDAKTVGDWITAIIPDQTKGLVDYIFTAVGGNKVFDTTGASAPPNMSPDGAGRGGAFNEAKRAAGIPVSQQPSAVYPNTDKRGNPQPGYQYEYTIPAAWRRYPNSYHPRRCGRALLRRRQLTKSRTAF